MSAAFLDILERLQADIADAPHVQDARTAAGRAGDSAYVEVLAEQLADAIAALRPLAHTDRLSL